MGLLWDESIITNRDEHPACSSIVKKWEFAWKKVFVFADPDPDGLTAAMKALWAMYPELEADSKILDWAPGNKTTEWWLSPLWVLLALAMSTLPPFNIKKPFILEKERAKLFTIYAKATQWDQDAFKQLGVKVLVFESLIQIAKNILHHAKTIAPWVVLVEAGNAQYDMWTLINWLEKIEGCKITVIKKTTWPHGTQFSFWVVKSEKNNINLQDFLPKEFTSTPEAWILSNTSFLLHVNEENFKKVIEKIKESS